MHSHQFPLKHDVPMKYKLVGLCEKRYDVVNALEDCVADNLTVCSILKTKFSSFFSFELID